MKTIKILQNTTKTEILEQIWTYLDNEKPFQLGRYTLTLRGSMWMVDDTISGLQNIDGYACSGYSVTMVAAKVYADWVADLWTVN